MVGKYYSHEWVRKTILQQTDPDIKENDEQIEEETESGEPRWINPAIMQNQEAEEQDQMQQQQIQQTNVKPLANDSDTDATPETDETNKKIRDAEATVALLGKQKNRTMQDETKYKSAVQILAKNK